jgi:hypothetical protein
MVTSPPSTTTKKPEWAFYMPYTVRVKTSGIPGIVLTPEGLGAFSAPLVSTQFSTMEHWSYHYFSSLGLAVASAVLAMVIFRFKTQEGRFSRSVRGTVNAWLTCVVECLLEIGQHPEEAEASEHSVYSQIFRLRAVHLMAFFILIYVGYVFCEDLIRLELNTHHLGWKLQSAAGSLRTSFRSEVVDRPPVIFPLVSLEV